MISNLINKISIRLCKARDIDIISVLSFIYLLENKYDNFEYIEEIIDTFANFVSINKKIIKNLIDNGVEDSSNVKKKILHIMREYYGLFNENIYSNTYKIILDPFLLSVSENFFKRFSDENNVWCAPNVFKIAILYTKKLLACDFNLLHSCAMRLIIGNCEITYDDYLKYLV